MSSTKHAPQLAHVAVGARPCTGLSQGYKWRAAVAMSSDMNLFTNETAIKHSARHLGKQPT